MRFYTPVIFCDRYDCVRKWLCSFAFAYSSMNKVVDNTSKQRQDGKQDIASAVSNERDNGADDYWPDAAS